MLDKDYLKTQKTEDIIDDLAHLIKYAERALDRGNLDNLRIQEKARVAIPSLYFSFALIEELRRREALPEYAKILKRQREAYDFSGKFFLNGEEDEKRNEELYKKLLLRQEKIFELVTEEQVKKFGIFMGLYEVKGEKLNSSHPLHTSNNFVLWILDEISLENIDPEYKDSHIFDKKNKQLLYIDPEGKPYQIVQIDEINFVQQLRRATKDRIKSMPSHGEAVNFLEVGMNEFIKSAGGLPIRDRVKNSKERSPYKFKVIHENIVAKSSLQPVKQDSSRVDFKDEAGKGIIMGYDEVSHALAFFFPDDEKNETRLKELKQAEPAFQTAALYKNARYKVVLASFRPASNSIGPKEVMIFKGNDGELRYVTASNPKKVFLLPPQFNKIGQWISALDEAKKTRTLNSENKEEQEVISALLAITTEKAYTPNGNKSVVAIHGRKPQKAALQSFMKKYPKHAQRGDLQKRLADLEAQDEHKLQVTIPKTAIEMPDLAEISREAVGSKTRHVVEKWTMASQEGKEQKAYFKRMADRKIAELEPLAAFLMGFTIGFDRVPETKLVYQKKKSKITRLGVLSAELEGESLSDYEKKAEKDTGLKLTQDELIEGGFVDKLVTDFIFEDADSHTNNIVIKNKKFYKFDLNEALTPDTGKYHGYEGQEMFSNTPDKISEDMQDIFNLPNSKPFHWIPRGYMQAPHTEEKKPYGEIHFGDLKGLDENPAFIKRKYEAFLRIIFLDEKNLSAVVKEHLGSKKAQDEKTKRIIERVKNIRAALLLNPEFFEIFLKNKNEFRHNLKAFFDHNNSILHQRGLGEFKIKLDEFSQNFEKFSEEAAKAKLAHDVAVTVGAYQVEKGGELSKRRERDIENISTESIKHKSISATMVSIETSLKNLETGFFRRSALRDSVEKSLSSPTIILSLFEEAANDPKLKNKNKSYAVYKLTGLAAENVENLHNIVSTLSCSNNSTVKEMLKKIPPKKPSWLDYIIGGIYVDAYRHLQQAYLKAALTAANDPQGKPHLFIEFMGLTAREKFIKECPLDVLSRQNVVNELKKFDEKDKHKDKKAEKIANLINKTRKKSSSSFGQIGKGLSGDVENKRDSGSESDLAYRTEYEGYPSSSGVEEQLNKKNIPADTDQETPVLGERRPKK